MNYTNTEYKKTIEKLNSLADKLDKLSIFTDLIPLSLEDKMDRLAADFYDLIEKLEDKLKKSR